MFKIIFIIFIIFINTSCSFDKVVRHHGIHHLEKKQQKLKIFENNINDTKVILGVPSTKSTFDNDVWIYIERKTTVSEFKTFGRKKLLENNVLVLEFDDRGILVKKEFYDKNQMKKIKISKKQTSVLDKKNSFISNVIQSLRHKINDPLGKRKVK